MTVRTSSKSKEVDGRVSIIGIIGLPPSYGGFETLVDNLVDDGGDNFVVYCSSKSYPKKVDTYKGALLEYIPLSASGIPSIFYDCWSIFHSLTNGRRRLLILGVSGAICLPIVRWLFPEARLVTNIDGLEWRREKWGFLPRKFLKLSEELAVIYSHSVITDNEVLADYVHGEYERKSTVIAYGGDHALGEAYPSTLGGYALSLCRIEPENNVHMILEAFSQLDYRIKFIGNWNNSRYGRGLRKRYGNVGNIEMMEPIYDIGDLAKIRASCDFYVHGHSAGGTNPSLVEIMHFGKGVLAYDCNFNRATTEGKARYFSNSGDLQALVQRGAAEYPKVGSAMREIAVRRYTWSIVRQQYLRELYPEAEPGVA